MSIVNAKELLLAAAENNYAVGAFNISNIIMMEGVVEAAIELNAPLIIQTSVTPSKFLKPTIVAAAYKILAETAPIPICLHLDHCDDLDYCKTCAEAGYTNIMIDASAYDFNTNIEKTAEVSDFCHNLGNISVEGELGTVGGVEDEVEVTEGKEQLCSADQAVEFVERSRIDIFAPAIGTAHGFYKSDNPFVDFDRLDQINQLLNGSGVKVPLVIHGGTGLAPDVVRKLVSLGGAKFNVSTDLKHTWINSINEYINEHRSEYNTARLDSFAKDAIRNKIKEWIVLLGSENKA